MHNDPTIGLNPDNAHRIYLCIDLKSFYASVECVDRGLNPMTTDLVVADPERTDKTICLAVSPSLKSKGVRNRCRLFEIPKHYQYIIAPPRMQRYIDVAAEIYGIYLQFVSKDDIHVYSIDECFLDITHYISYYHMTAKELAVTIMNTVQQRIGVRATCGIGTNLYLTKVALDITAKHAPDFIGFLDEDTYRKTLWQHRPLTDFWRIGSGIAAKLEHCGITTMEGIAKADEERIFKLFGIDAELLIDHAWGWETTTIADIKQYRSKTNCLSNGQVLPCDYNFNDGLLIVKEMMDALCLEMASKKVVTDQVMLYVGYSNQQPHVPGAHGSTSIPVASCADSVWLQEITKLYHRIVRQDVPIRRIGITCGRLQTSDVMQVSLFDDPVRQERDHNLQSALNNLKSRYGRNAVLRAMDLQENATAIARNQQIGGHRSGDDQGT